jgi:hypothetical protein
MNISQEENENLYNYIIIKKKTHDEQQTHTHMKINKILQVQNRLIDVLRFKINPISF